MIESLSNVIKLVIALKNESHTIHLLRALPLLHLLRGDCTPFQHCVVRPSAIIWNDPSIDFTTTQQVISSNKGSVIHQLLSADHVQTIFSMCSMVLIVQCRILLLQLLFIIT